jgi:hypothetical protein
MSFASETKKELTLLQLEPCCQKAECSAFIQINGSVLIHNQQLSLEVNTENAAIARRFYTLIKNNYHINADLLVRKKMRLKKNNVYIVRFTRNVRLILEDLGLLDASVGINNNMPRKFNKKCCKRSYLRGAFLAGGSLNHPESGSYHLEIFTKDSDQAAVICKLMNTFKLNAKMIERKKGYVVYLKEGEKIVSFLSIIGAHQALLKYEDIRIVKDMRNSVNRLVNCETANLNKTIEAAMRQVENIRFIDEKLGISKLPERLRQVAELRMRYPEANLTELGELLPGKVSKSGVNHRLRKLDEMAKKLKENDE